MDNDNNNKNRNSEIFLGIVGVATLIVAIIGASFSYFIASASSEDSAVNITAYDFNASLTLEPIYASDAKMIPFDPYGDVEGAQAPNDKNLKYALNVAKRCTDDQGFKVCALYHVMITNNSTTDSITLKGSIVTEESTKFENLMYLPVTKDGDIYNVGSSSTAVKLKTVSNESIDITDNMTIAPDSIKDVYVLIYLNELGLNEEPQTGEMGGTYKGKIVFTSVGEGTANNKLTGTFIVN